jgi:hypothetical protein
MSDSIQCKCIPKDVVKMIIYMTEEIQAREIKNQCVEELKEKMSQTAKWYMCYKQQGGLNGGRKCYTVWYMDYKLFLRGM